MLASQRYCLYSLILICATLGKNSTIHAAPRPTIRSFEDVEKITRQHFSELDGHTSGDIITQKDVRILFRKLDAAGWKIPVKEEILKRVVKEGEFLDRVTSTDNGRRFLDKIKRYPLGIDRLDRMSRLPNGQESVSDLIHKIPNGHEWIEALTTTKQGKNVGKSISKAAKGKNFNKPTGRYYFELDLTKVLKIVYQKTQSKTVRNKYTRKTSTETP